MNKLLKRIMLDCNEATRLVSIRKYNRLSLKQRIQLSLHLMACKLCKDYSEFNDLVDDSLENVCQHDHNDQLSENKKDELKSMIEKNIKQKK